MTTHQEDRLMRALTPWAVTAAAIAAVIATVLLLTHQAPPTVPVPTTDHGTTQTQETDHR